MEGWRPVRCRMREGGIQSGVWKVGWGPVKGRIWRVGVQLGVGWGRVMPR